MCAKFATSIPRRSLIFFILCHGNGKTCSDKRVNANWDYVCEINAKSDRRRLNIIIMIHVKLECSRSNRLKTTFHREFDGYLCGAGTIRSDHQHIAANINWLIILYDDICWRFASASFQCGAGHNVERSLWESESYTDWRIYFLLYISFFCRSLSFSFRLHENFLQFFMHTYNNHM